MNEYEKTVADTITSRVIRLFSGNEIRESCRVKKVAKYGKNCACCVSESWISR